MLTLSLSKEQVEMMVEGDLRLEFFSRDLESI